MASGYQGGVHRPTLVSLRLQVLLLKDIVWIPDALQVEEPDVRVPIELFKESIVGVNGGKPLADAFPVTAKSR